MSPATWAKLKWEKKVIRRGRDELGPIGKSHGEVKIRF